MCETWKVNHICSPSQKLKPDWRQQTIWTVNLLHVDISLGWIRDCQITFTHPIRHTKFNIKSQHFAFYSLYYTTKILNTFCIQPFQLRLSPEQSGKVEYERERLLGIANKFIHLLAIPSSLSRSYSTFPLCSGDNLN